MHLSPSARTFAPSCPQHIRNAFCTLHFVREVRDPFASYLAGAAKERSMTLAVSTKHLKQYKDIAMLLWKYGRSDLVKKSGLEAYLPERPSNGRHTEDQKVTAEANQLATDLENLGPTY